MIDICKEQNDEKNEHLLTSWRDNAFFHTEFNTIQFTNILGFLPCIAKESECLRLTSSQTNFKVQRPLRMRWSAD